MVEARREGGKEGRRKGGYEEGREGRRGGGRYEEGREEQEIEEVKNQHSPNKQLLRSIKLTGMLTVWPGLNRAPWSKTP